MLANEDQRSSALSRPPRRPTPGIFWSIGIPGVGLAKRGRDLRCHFEENMYINPTVAKLRNCSSEGQDGLTCQPVVEIIKLL